MKKSEFTIAEYIQENNLDVELRDSFALKMVAAHLRGLGYSSKRTRDGTGKTVIMWTKSSRKQKLAELAAKLNRLEGRP